MTEVMKFANWRGGVDEVDYKRSDAQQEHDDDLDTNNSAAAV